MFRKSLGPEPLIHASADVQDSKLGRYTEVGARTSMIHTTFGDYSYVVNDGSIINATIGKFCSIAAMVRINPGNHPMDRVSQSHFTYRSSAYFDGAEDDESVFEARRSRPVTIGHDVWLGHGVIVLPGCNIGDGAAVGAGSVVTKDIPPYTIVAGQPAKMIRPRFEPETVAGMANLTWWDWEHDQLQVALDDFRTLAPDRFIEKYRN